MKNKFMYSAMLVVGITFATTYGNNVFSQARLTSSDNQLSLEANTYSLSDSMKVDVVRDTTGLENLQKEMLMDSSGMEKMHMQMKKDSLSLKTGEMKHDTTAVKANHLNMEHMYKEKDVKIDTTKIR